MVDSVGTVIEDHYKHFLRNFLAIQVACMPVQVKKNKRGFPSKNILSALLSLLTWFSAEKLKNGQKERRREYGEK